MKINKGQKMKKVVMLMFLAAFLIGGNIRPAQALIVDVTQIATKVSDWVQKIKDSVNKVTQQVKQIELTARQGFNLDAVRNMAEDYFKKYLNDQFSSYLNKRLFILVNGTKEKQIHALEHRKELYHKAINKLTEEKAEITRENSKFIDMQQAGEYGELVTAIEKCATLENIYNAAVNADDPSASEKYIEWQECESMKAKIQNDLDETAALASDLSDQIHYKLESHTSTPGELEIVEEGDETEKGLERRIAELKAESEKDVKKEEIIQKETEQDIEWDSEGNAKSYSPTAEDYAKFINDYFYDPADLADVNPQVSRTQNDKKEYTWLVGEEKDIGEAYDNRAIVYQSNADRIMRNRKFLFVNTAIHLMQVATSVRREIPLREEAMKNIKETPSNGELEAMINYSASRIESARSLLLYSKLLAAKLQYLAGRDILQAKPQKEIKGKNFGSSDLEKYILDSEYLKKLVDEANELPKTKEN